MDCLDKEALPFGGASDFLGHRSFPLAQSPASY